MPRRGRQVGRLVAAGQDAAVHLGCRVLTRPSIISGKPVTSETPVTGRPAVGQRAWPCRRSRPARIRAPPAPGRTRRGRSCPKRSATLYACPLDPFTGPEGRIKSKTAQLLTRNAQIHVDTWRHPSLSSPCDSRMSGTRKGRERAAFFVASSVQLGGRSRRHGGDSHSKEEERCASQARSSGSTTPRATASSSVKAAATCSCTSRRSRAPASGRSRKARRVEFEIVDGPKGPQAGNVQLS